MTELIKYRQLGILLLIWLVGAAGDLLWLALDNAVPDWDRADYLTGSLNYWHALQQVRWLDGDWWRSFWLLSSKIPPFTYTAAGAIQSWVGTGVDRAMLVNLLFSGVLLSAVYGLGVELFDAEVGLWAAGLCQLMPGLYRLRLDFLLDYPLAAVVCLCFWCLTVWRERTAKTRREEGTWWWAIAFGASFGVALLVKQTALLFLLIPIVWVGVEAVVGKRWKLLLQLAVALVVALAICGFWYRVNWLFVLTSGKRATIDSAIAENDPALDSLAAWSYYWQVLPYQVSWLLLVVPIGGWLLFGWWRSRRREKKFFDARFGWLMVFWLGAYLLCSLNVNKDSRYVLPYLPVVALFLAYGLRFWAGRLAAVRWVTLGFAGLLMLLNLYPVGGLGNALTAVFSPYAQHYAYLKPELPHRQVIGEIVRQQPYLRSTLGVLPSTAEFNQHNFNYFGALQNFQVYGRQVGTREKQIDRDARSINWFLTKSGDQGSVSDVQAKMVAAVERSPDFQLDRSWQLPDSTLNLYRRRVIPVEVQEGGHRGIALSQVTVPASSPPGVAVPVTYEWSGSWDNLRSGLVLLSWENQQNATGWLHDRALGMGNLYSGTALQGDRQFHVTERLAMLPPQDTPPGIYTLKSATYLNRFTGESYAISVPPVKLEINSASKAVSAPELDLATQLRTLAASLPQGTKVIESIFAEVARINQYDPIQDYLKQVELTMKYRLKSEPANPAWAYALALSEVLQRDVDGAIAALEQVTKLDEQNPYAHAYLAFVRLYNFQPRFAQISIDRALTLNPNIKELQLLDAIAALMQGNLIKVWHYLPLIKSL
ncbi:phospholipid carrier-dependent glycosyltransferase [Aliterella atlantica]|uniref:Glycosyl transferase n=1 Tax=Aliterella atlantica CENA595 TaxID=1618023 RepID=A0A0D8ZYL3_9CYAN|nr:glycosyltransferase family 39 protein [Aliterella atlantica]KJH72291.1 glycosyl transferase [Aliterella atlantica CENA595]